MRDILTMARKALQNKADPEARRGTQRFFKEEIRPYGVKSADVNAIARRVWAAVKKRPKADIFGLCDLFWESGFMEEGGIACELAYSMRKSYAEEDFAVFDRWLEAYVRNWAHCDMLCTRSVAAFIGIYPAFAPRVHAWAEAENRWKKRAAAVSFVPLARKGKYLEEVFSIADTLLPDTDDMVQKGYGWMLKAAGETHPEAVFAFLMERRETMPRTAFRYALEKLPPAMRAQAMGRK